MVVRTINSLPSLVMPSTAADAVESLKAMLSGITQRSEPRTNLQSAVDAYIDVAGIISRKLDKDSERELWRKMILPLIAQHVRPTPDLAQWTLPNHLVGLVTKAMTSGIMPSILEEEWFKYGRELSQLVVDSIPELNEGPGEGYHQAQENLIERATRFASLQERALQADVPEALRSAFSAATTSVIFQCVEALHGRNGEPYGVASVVAELVQRSRSLLVADDRVFPPLKDFVQHQLPKNIMSPSSAQLLRILEGLKGTDAYESAWTASLATLLEEASNARQQTLLGDFLRSGGGVASSDFAMASSPLQLYLKTYILAALDGDCEWEPLNGILACGPMVISNETRHAVFLGLVERLSSQDTVSTALEGLRRMLTDNSMLILPLLFTPDGSTLLCRLLLLADSLEDGAQEAFELSSELQALMLRNNYQDAAKHLMHSIVFEQLWNPSPNAPAAATLTDFATALWDEAPIAEMAAHFVPDLKAWDEAMDPFISRAPSASLALVSPLGEAISIAAPWDPRTSTAGHIKHDDGGFSIALRLLQYFTRLASDTPVLDLTFLQDKENMLLKLALTVELMEDKFAHMASNDVWVGESPNDVGALKDEAVRIAGNQLQKILNSSEVKHNDTESSLLGWTTGKLAACNNENPATIFHRCRAYCRLVGSVTSRGSANLNPDPRQLQDCLRSVQQGSSKCPAALDVEALADSLGILGLLGFLHIFRAPLAASKCCERLCNETVADLTGLDISTSPESGMQC